MVLLITETIPIANVLSLNNDYVDKGEHIIDNIINLKNV